MTEWLSIVSALGGPLAGVLAAIVTVRLQYQKFHTELELQREKLKQEHDRLKAEFATEGSVEAAVRHLLELSNLPYRSFPMIRHHIGGFEANELRKLLVRSGAVRFMAADGTELWALRERVVDDFRRSRWKRDQAPLNKVPQAALFPAAFNDPAQF